MVPWERLCSVLLIAFGIFVAIYARSILKLGLMISPGAGFMPFLVGLSLVVLGALWFAQTFLRGAAQREAPTGKSPAAARPGRSFAWKLVTGIVVLVCYAWLLERVGYFLSTLLFMAGWQKIVEKEAWLKTVTIAVLCTLAMYALFVFLLKVHLPAGSWFS